MARRPIVWIGVLAVLGALPAPSASAATPSSLPKPKSNARPVCSASISPRYVSCMAWVKTDESGNPLVTPTVAGMTPAQFHTAYNLPATAVGHHTIAIVDAYSSPTIYADLKKYQTTFGVSTYHKCLSAAQTNCLLVLNQTGRTSPLPPPNAGWATEIALDVEIARAICQNCRIEL